QTVGTGNIAGNVTLSAPSIDVGGTVGSTLSVYSGASPNPFTNNVYAQYSINAPGTSGGVVTITEPGVVFTSTLYSANADFTSTSTAQVTISSTPSFFVNSPLHTGGGSAGYVAGNSVTINGISIPSAVIVGNYGGNNGAITITENNTPTVISNGDNVTPA